MLENYRDVLTVKEVAEVLRIGKNAAYSLVRDNKIKSVKVGRKYLVSKQILLDFLGNSRYNIYVD
jgi:excisionase family DNA binding protein